MMDSEVVIRKVLDADVERLAKLYDNVWPEESSEVHINKANFVLRDSVGVSFCAERNGVLVGSRTSYYNPVFIADRRIKCAVVGDSCVHSSCRRQGLFTRMNEAFLKEFFGNCGGELVYNISEDASRAAYEKLGWVYIKALTGVRKYVRPFHILKLVHFDIRKLRGTVKIDIRSRLQHLDEQLLDSREKLLHDYIHVKYDVESFSWRIKSQNGIRVLPLDCIGAVVYKVGLKPCGARVLIIGEIFLYEYNKKNMKLVEKELIRVENPDIILSSITKAHPLFSLYKQIGYCGGNTFSNHGVKVVSEEMRKVCLNPQNWGLSFMDIDTF